MIVFPVFINLDKKKCVIIGGGGVAARRIKILMEFNANITVVSPKIKDEIKRISEEKKICVIKKEYSKEDIDNAFLVIAATSDKSLNIKIAEDAKDKNVLVNVVDNTENSTFIFPSIVTRGDVSVGISTSGSYPLLAKKIRKKIENIIPKYYEELIDILRDYRTRALTHIRDKKKQKEFMNRILDDELIENKKTYKMKVEQIYKKFCD